jgi:hypothetical protein
MSSFDIKNSVAFVAGTNKPNGIGRAIVEALVAGGAAKSLCNCTWCFTIGWTSTDILLDNLWQYLLMLLTLRRLPPLSSLYPDVTLLVNNAGYFASTSSLDDVNQALKELLVNYIAPLAIAKS